MAAPHSLQARVRWPSLKTWCPARVGSPQCGQITFTFDTSIGLLALDYAALHAAPRVSLVVALYDVYALDYHLALARLHLDDAPLLAFIFACDDDHAVVLANIYLYVHNPQSQKSVDVCLAYLSLLLTSEFFQITSGARLTIFMKRLSRSSRATGPNTRVPTGSLSGLIITAAFWSKRM